MTSSTQGWKLVGSGKTTKCRVYGARNKSVEDLLIIRFIKLKCIKFSLRVEKFFFLERNTLGILVIYSCVISYPKLSSIKQQALIFSYRL